MRMMLLTEQYPPDINVAGIRMHEMVNVFSRQGVDIRVVVYDPLTKSEHFKSHHKTHDNMSVVRYGWKYLPKPLYFMHSINPFTLLCWMFFTLKESIDYKPDILIATIPIYIPTISAFVASRILKKPFCVDIRDDFISVKFIDYIVAHIPWYGQFISRSSYGMIRRLFLWSCRSALLFSIVNESMRNEIVTYIHPDKPIVLVPNGINLQELESVRQQVKKANTLKKYGISKSDGAKFIIFVGMVGEYYKPEVLLDTIKSLREDHVDINYIIVGDGPSKNKIGEIVKELHLEDNVFLLGKKVHQEVLELLLASDIAFYSLAKDHTLSDCFLSVKALEYIACKLPILSIANSNSSVSEVITKYGIGIALNWDETDKIGPAIKKILSDGQYSKKLDKYYENFIREFNRSANNKRLYEAILKAYDFAGQ